VSADYDQGALTDALAEELWGCGHELGAEDILEALAAAGLMLDVNPEAPIWGDSLAADLDELPPEFVAKLADISEMHDMIHTAPDDPDSIVFASLTDREFLIIALGLVHTGIQHCCLEERSALLSRKLFDVYAAQRVTEAG
jgi:hypothetical protein